ncbi:hypothetical protein [Priestia megaterium]|uniref:hypothetical protein n=1 Tax=Priestia megaterium TaxID=1404 RepID=UPI002E22DD2B|nr:hypothetical protein [Priestia megaterium]
MNKERFKDHVLRGIQIKEEYCVYAIEEAERQIDEDIKKHTDESLRKLVKRRRLFLEELQQLQKDREALYNDDFKFDEE